MKRILQSIMIVFLLIVVSGCGSKDTLQEDALLTIKDINKNIDEKAVEINKYLGPEQNSWYFGVNKNGGSYRAFEDLGEANFYRYFLSNTKDPEILDFSSIYTEKTAKASFNQYLDSNVNNSNVDSGSKFNYQVIDINDDFSIYSFNYGGMPFHMYGVYNAKNRYLVMLEDQSSFFKTEYFLKTAGFGDSLINHVKEIMVEPENANATEAKDEEIDSDTIAKTIGAKDDGENGYNGKISDFRKDENNLNIELKYLPENKRVKNEELSKNKEISKAVFFNTAIYEIKKINMIKLSDTFYAWTVNSTDDNLLYITNLDKWYSIKMFSEDKQVIIDKLKALGYSDKMVEGITSILV